MSDEKTEKDKQDVAGFPNVPDFDQDAENDSPPEKTEGS